MPVPLAEDDERTTTDGLDGCSMSKGIERLGGCSISKSIERPGGNPR